MSRSVEPRARRIACGVCDEVVNGSAGVEVLDQPFHAKDTIATAGGCLASHYLAAWIIARLAGHDAAEGALHYVAPVGEKGEYVERAWRNITPYLHGPAPALV
ncbi:hypothetical protein ACFW4X_25175 [Streptomyces smyrnaeus]|uniref:hypothetical protein n=1 Tax=Streptomyces smyrnaeus TaxID=1387713 RepID=UPI0036C127F9